MRPGRRLGFIRPKARFMLEINLDGVVGEGADGGLGVLEEIDGGIVVVLVVHGAEARVGIQHGFLHFHTQVLDKGGLDAQPLPSLGVVGADGDLRVRGDLLGDVLHVAGLDIELALDDLGGPERTDLRLVAVCGGKEIDASLVQEISYLLHIILV